MSETKNLGFVKSIFVDVTPPSNIQALWYDDNVGQKIHKYYDTVTSSWKPLSKSLLWGQITGNINDQTDLITLINDSINIPSDTYANWSEEKTAGTLPKGQKINISDRGIVLFCEDIDKFDVPGVYFSGGAWNACNYDFDNNILIKVEDLKGNQLGASSLAGFPLNNSIATKNVAVNGTIHLSGFSGDADQNTVQSSAVFDLTNASCIAFWNNILSGTCVLANSAGNFVRNIVDVLDGTLSAVMNSGVTIINCRFFLGCQLDPAVPYSDKSYMRGYSDFDISTDITGLSIIPFDIVTGTHIGIVDVTSTNPTETLISSINHPTTHPVEYRPQNGLTLTFQHGTGADQWWCDGGIDLVCNGSDGDTARFKNRETYPGSGVYRNFQQPGQ